VLQCAKSVTMGRQRLMRRVGIILPDLVVPGRLPMKLSRVSMMCRSRSMVPCCGLTGGHGDPLPQLVRAPATYPRNDRRPKVRKLLRPLHTWGAIVSAPTKRANYFRSDDNFIQRENALISIRHLALVSRMHSVH
jgi:hypothetical protein